MTWIKHIKIMCDECGTIFPDIGATVAEVEEKAEGYDWHKESADEHFCPNCTSE